MELFTDEIMRDLLASSLKTATFDGKVWRDPDAGPGSTEGQFVDWLTIKEQAKSVTADVKRIRNHPLVPSDIPIYGYVYDVKTGRLVEVPEATVAGKLDNPQGSHARRNRVVESVARQARPRVPPRTLRL